MTKIVAVSGRPPAVREVSSTGTSRLRKRRQIAFEDFTQNRLLPLPRVQRGDGFGKL